MSIIRIKGLVRIAQDMRARIARGMTEGEMAAARRDAERAVAEVARMLASQKTGPEHLAEPSRRAYQFLKTIPWEQMTCVAGASPQSRARNVRWDGLGTLVDRLTLSLALAPESGALENAAGVIERMSARIEGTIRRDGLAADQLTQATRELRAWLAFFALRPNLELYLAAVNRAGRILRQGAPLGEKVVLQFRPTAYLYRMTRYADGRRIVMPTAMIVFDESQFTDLAALIWQRDRGAKRQVEEHLRADVYTDLLEELEGLGGVVERTRGAVHDLGESFDRVNARYFAGSMPRPRLNWSRGFTRRKFGHYSFSSDSVMISSTLDQPNVPAYVVDFIMYHELLHKKHGIRWQNNRGHAHTPEFYAEERRFERYAEAEAMLSTLAKG